ncbi:hypothetical protein THIOM_002663 [Candidatus Thiomargarita nelsonii]|uniref:Uncharacterized protein n=1 Tax=Candidatus Thiomargarita nelsonii TaxID=1003181 RepID=A0A176S0Q2_9GAMM|nr:hypothetical protein THIOM_002663 [Candidatus Thiomargarita nelsonii]
MKGWYPSTIRENLAKYSPYADEAVYQRVSVYLDTVSVILCNIPQVYRGHDHIWQKYVVVLFVCGQV